MNMSAVQYRSLIGAPKRHKYGARRTVVDGIKFDSEKEARRYSELLLLLRSNHIGYLERQPVFHLKAYPDGTVVGEYRADFKYVDNATGKLVVEDVKSKVTAKLGLYIWKKRHVKAQYGIEIREV